MWDSTRHPIEAAWARIGKIPGDREDFGILATSSSGLIDVGLHCEEFLAGFPSSAADPNAPWTPPWATFGVHKDSLGAPLISVAIQFWWEGRDQANRAIWPRNFFAVRYADTAEGRLSFGALYRAVEHVELPFQDHLADRTGRRGRLAIEAPPGDMTQSYRAGGMPPGEAYETRPYLLDAEPPSPAGILAAVDRFGFRWLAGVAAALLDRPVAVGGTLGLTLADRLDLLDAIAALLPYGFRADLSASSAVSETSMPRMRLILTEDAFDGRLGVIRGRPPEGELSPLAAEYMSTLLRKAQLSGGIENVIVHQRAAAAASSFAHPEDALHWLRQLDRQSDLFRRAARDGRIDRGLAVEVSKEPLEVVAEYWEGWPEPRRHSMVEVLVDPLDETTGPALVRLWSIAFPEIVRTVSSRLDQGRADVAMHTLTLAESSLGMDEADRLLAFLLLPDQADEGADTAESWLHRRDSSVSLLLQRPVPAPGTFGTTLMVLPLGRAADWQAVLVHTLLSRELAGASANGGRRVRDWVSWFQESAYRQAEDRPAWAVALDFVGGDHVGARGVVQRVAAEELGWAGLVIRLAKSLGRLPEVLGDLRTDIIKLALRERAGAGRASAGRRAAPGRENPQDGLAVALAGSFRSADVSPETLAIVDAARVILGIGITDCPPLQSEAFQRYWGADGLGQVFNVLAEEPEWEALEEGAFLAHAVRGPADGPAPLPKAVITLIADWCTDRRRAPGLARHINQSDGDALVRTLLHYDQLSPDQWRRLAQYVPRFGPLASAAQLRKAVIQTIRQPGRELPRETSGGVRDPGPGRPGRYLEPQFAMDSLDAEPEQRTPRGSVLDSSLATAMYDARLDGMEIPQILDVLHGAEVHHTTRGRLTLVDRTVPSEIWDVLREFQSQLRNQPLTEEARGLTREQAERDAQRDLRLCLDLIIFHGALGADYAPKFQDFYLEQSRRMEKIYKEERKRYRRRLRRHGGRHDTNLGTAPAPGAGAATPMRADDRGAVTGLQDQRQYQQQESGRPSAGAAYPGHVYPPPAAVPGQAADQPPRPPKSAQPVQDRPRKRWRDKWRRLQAPTGSLGAPSPGQQDDRR